MAGRHVGRRVYVKRRGPCPAAWLALLTGAALMAFVFLARPAIQTLSVDLNQPPEAQEPVTQDVSLEAMEIHLVVLAQQEDPIQARIEAARYAPRGAAGYLLERDGVYQVVGNGYAALEEAEKVAQTLEEEEDIPAQVLSCAGAGALLRVTATPAQQSALAEGEALARRLEEELRGHALALDRGERQAPVVRAALSLCAQEAQQAGDRLSRAAGETPNPVAAGVIQLLEQLAQDCGQLAQEEQDTPLTFSSRLKYAYLAAVLGHIDFLNSLVPA